MSTITKPLALSLDAQLQEVEAARHQWRCPARGTRRAEVDEHDRRLGAVADTLRWLRDHRELVRDAAELERLAERLAEVRAFLELPEHLRDVVRTHGPFVADLAMQQKRREAAVAQAGGPKL